MVVSRLTLPANHTLENQPHPAPLPLLPYTTRGGRIVNKYCDMWGFIAIVDVYEPESMKEYDL